MATVTRVSWTTPVLVFAAACITFGILWDISWHATIGRDTFWTPAHMMIYVGGTLGGMLAGWMAIRATFLARERAVGETVGVGVLRAPLGAWVCMWGGLAMLTSAPFDDWWHNAYGLDVKIISPPHALLALGMYGVVIGTHLLAASELNRVKASSGAGHAGLEWLTVTANGVALALASILLTELSFPNLQHTANFAMVSAAMYPAFLVAAARQAPVKWCATRVAAVYMAVLCIMVWVLPLFPAEPKLAPVYNRVTHMTPPAFPLLLILPALGLDMLFASLRDRTGKGWDAMRVVGSAALFLAVFLPVQWYFSRFLISPMADNAFFAGHGRFFGYSGNLEFRDRFWRSNDIPLTAISVGWAWMIALGSSAVGFVSGQFLSRIKR